MRDDQGQAPDGRRPEGPAGDRVVTSRCPRGGPRRASAATPGKTTVATGPDGRAHGTRPRRSPRTRSAPTTSTPATTRWPRAGPAATSTRGWSARSGSPRCSARRDRTRAGRRRGVEGVMGLFDGATHPSVEPGFASTAHVAALLRAPVVLVVDASAQARASPRSCTGSPPSTRTVRLGGVVLNRVGSDRHEAILREALAAAGVPVLGAIRRLEQLHTPSRHLGLVPAAERSAEAVATVRRLGEVVAEGVDLTAILALARSAPPLEATAWDPAVEVDAGRRDARGSRVAGGAGLHVRVRRERRAAVGRRRRRRARRPAARRGSAAGDGRAGPRRWLPGGLRRRAVGQRGAASRRRRAGRPGRTGRRGVRRACCTSPASWTACRCAGCSTSRRR